MAKITYADKVPKRERMSSYNNDEFTLSDANEVKTVVNSLYDADKERIKNIIVSTYNDMINQAVGDQVLIFGVTSDTVNMDGAKGAYIYIPEFGIGQIAINFI